MRSPSQPLLSPSEPDNDFMPNLRASRVGLARERNLQEAEAEEAAAAPRGKAVAIALLQGICCCRGRWEGAVATLYYSDSYPA